MIGHTFKADQSDLSYQLRHLATVRGFLLVCGAALDVHRRHMVGRAARLCLTKLRPKLVRSSAALCSWFNEEVLSSSDQTANLSSRKLLSLGYLLWVLIAASSSRFPALVRTKITLSGY